MVIISLLVVTSQSIYWLFWNLSQLLRHQNFLNEDVHTLFKKKYSITLKITVNRKKINDKRGGGEPTFLFRQKKKKNTVLCILFIIYFLVTTLPRHCFRINITISSDIITIVLLYQVYWLGPLLGGLVAGLLYDNVFAMNASLVKARGLLLSSQYDNEKFPASKPKIRVIEEEDEEDRDPLSSSYDSQREEHAQKPPESP